MRAGGRPSHPLETPDSVRLCREENRALVLPKARVGVEEATHENLFRLRTVQKRLEPA